MPDNPLTPVDEALRLVLEQCAPLSAELAQIDQAIGRALSTEVLARRTLPPFDNSAMDGYALRSADASAPGARLSVVERIFAGQTPSRALQPGECARIMTGARLPQNADAVVMQERTRAIGADQVELLEAVRPRANVRDQGEDSRATERLLPAGTELGVPEAGLLWAQGLREVSVPRRARVAIASSGDELAPVGSDGAQIIDTNSPSLALAVSRAGAVPQPLGIAADRLDAVAELFAKGLSADVLITIAGVSVGERDFVRAALEQLGVEIIFHRVAMKPAKPVLFGRRGQTLVFGLPGNPTSALVAFELFVLPALRALQGLAPAWPVVPGRLGVPYLKQPGLTHLVRVTTRLTGGALVATPLPSQTSGALSSAAGANYLMLLPAQATAFQPGDPVDLIPVSWAARQK